MNTVWLTIAGQIWKYLEPWLAKKWKEVEPKILPFIGEKFDEFAPKILKTILVGMAQAAGQLTVNTTDKVTDIIPGQLDDRIVDQFVENSVDRLKDLFGIRF